ncbi:hypothetical protein LEP1GSC202_1511 [Leptospira yanagawae serovar Saopaulo str. Sao Paulo = ATCC 700523]|uniref:Uncharacterized protein n=1 Tax=Leptospira yanagawae serovar Saopaulo str. Sao Paulo = ATCC 700523 TaxID=1249483 RepID=A0A5E8HCH4_9LEPT|nr:hypothetical protein LEP1GSC202_1511 [Leptospira yanagawae serovar Saopaulo str. Sao Paulo = ATCC 700523]
MLFEKIDFSFGTAQFLDLVLLDTSLSLNTLIWIKRKCKL